MATVYLAHDLRHDRQVALKVLHPELAATLGPSASSARSSSPPGSSTPTSCRSTTPATRPGSSGSRMPFVEGEIAPRPAPPRAPAVGRRGAPHRQRGGRTPSTTPTSTASSTATSSPRTSCSPATARRSSPTSASPARSRGDDASSPQTGIAIGTPAYMSPEQAAGDRTSMRAPTSTRSASVLYEMLAGEPPFTGPDGAGDHRQAAHASRRRACEQARPSVPARGGRRRSGRR